MKEDKLLCELDRWKNELDYYLPLTQEEELRLWQKLRLDWNYHASKIEDLALKLHGLRELLLNTGNLKLKDVKGGPQIKGHDEAITRIKIYASSSEKLNESFIRELHITLLQDVYFNEAITSSGEPVKKQVVLGEYKQGETVMFGINGKQKKFASATEVNILMPELINWCNERMSNGQLHALTIATEFHNRFLRIHPFDDGNGRMARLLSNFILLRNGYYPIIITAEDKDTYLAALDFADNSDYLLLRNLFAKKVIAGIREAINIIQGKSLDTKDALEKKILLLTKKIETNYMSVSKSTDNLLYVLEQVYKPLLYKTEASTKGFSHLFVQELWCYFEEPDKKGISMRHSTGSLEDITEYFKSVAKNGGSYHSYKAIKFFMDFRERNNAFNVEVAFQIYFREFSYRISVAVGMPLESSSIMRGLKRIFKPLEKNDPDPENGFLTGFEYTLAEVDYANKINESDIDNWATILGHRLFEYIERKSKAGKP